MGLGNSNQRLKIQTFSGNYMEEQAENHRI